MNSMDSRDSLVGKYYKRHSILHEMFTYGKVIAQSRDEVTVLLFDESEEISRRPITHGTINFEIEDFLNEFEPGTVNPREWVSRLEGMFKVGE